MDIGDEHRSGFKKPKRRIGAKSSALDTSESEFEGQKKVRVNSPSGSGTDLNASGYLTPVEAGNEARIWKKNKKKNSGRSVADMQKITGDVVDYLKENGAIAEVIFGIRDFTDRYEAFILESLLENERLKGRIDILEGISGEGRALSSLGGVPGGGHVRPVLPGPIAMPATGNVSVPPVIPKAVETWSVVVRGKNGVSSKEVVDKVRADVGPTLGVRVHDLFPLRKGGGAVIRMPSKAEREKVVNNAKFKEVGLEISVNEKLGPKVVVQRVPSEITVNDFMSDLYEKNFKAIMSMDAFKSEVRLASSPWTPSEKSVNVILEGSARSMKYLLDMDRCYVKWFSFRVHRFDLIPCCYRCLGFDHRISECKVIDEVCRQCCQGGHRASLCKFTAHCRNCALKGKPAGHLMLSEDCPIYGAMVSRVKSRH